MTYQELIGRIVALQNDGLELFNAGKSVLGKNLLATHVGDYSGPQILIQGGIHAREYITSLLLVEMARNTFLNDLVHGGGIYYVFLVDPDGAEIVLDGIDAVNCEITRNYLISANNGSLDFSQYKANINLVDLNTNFNADWGGGSQNVFCPSTEDFVGFYPESEREVQSLINFTLQTRPLLTISYHTKGEVIYYGFEDMPSENLIRDQLIGESFSEYTGYPLVFTENSTGGYKDWCINRLKIPAYTIEVGSADLPHPLGEESLPEIYEKNKNIPLIALEKAKEYANQIDFALAFVQNKSKGENYDGKTKATKPNAKGYYVRMQSRIDRRSSNRRGDR